LSSVAAKAIPKDDSSGRRMKIFAAFTGFPVVDSSTRPLRTMLEGGGGTIGVGVAGRESPHPS
jgi:hypothetical protein